MKLQNKKAVLALSFISALSLTAIAADDSKAPDNTEKNTRDRSGETKTAGDQSNSPEDLKITQNIRQALVRDDALSTTAKNVKVITADGTVTLRGPVDTAEEKTKIEKLAKAAAGEAKVHNQLEVKAAK